MWWHQHVYVLWITFNSNNNQTHNNKNTLLILWFKKNSLMFQKYYVFLFCFVYLLTAIAYSIPKSSVYNVLKSCYSNTLAIILEAIARKIIWKYISQLAKFCFSYFFQFVDQKELKLIIVIVMLNLISMNT